MPEIACIDALNAVIASVRPRSLLLLGAHAREQVRSDVLPRECELTVLEERVGAAALARLSQFDLVYVAGVVEGMSKNEAVTLLGQLRDLHTQRLYLRVPIGPDWPDQESHWEQNDLIALGMEQAAVCDEGPRPVHLYRFDIYTYKRAPEWFNAKYWAHPELWNK